MSSWRTLILRIGEKSPDYGTNSVDFRDHIETCFGVLRRELDHCEDDIFKFLLECAEQLPHKIPFYGTLVGLLNLENDGFVNKVVETIHTKLQEALDGGNCNRIRILMRFLTVLMCCKVVQPSALLVVFETLLSSAATIVDEEKGNPSWQACADFYVTCILSCLPWGGSELIEQVPEEIERVIVGIEAYLSIRRHCSDIGVSAFENSDSTHKVHSEKDFLEDLWGRIQDLSNNGWKLDSVPKAHLQFEAQLVAGKSHDFGPINCPKLPDAPVALSGIAFGRQKHDAELKYPQRIRRLNIFTASKTEDLQSIDRFVVEEYLLDVLLFLNGCRKECASYMVGLPVPFRYEYLMAETIFSQLLLLPQPPFKPTYYTLVIIDLCKALPGAFPAVVAGAVRSLFDKIAELDMECRTRLILWFSHHLSNFQFIWPWEEWAYVLNLPKWAPKRVFVQEVLEREVRLSYWDKVKQSIENASALEALLPPKGGPYLKYSAEDADQTEVALSAEIKGMVKVRKTAREVIVWMDENVVPVHGLDVAVKVIVHTLLDIGAKSFTHLITVLERYGQVIAKICPDHEKQILLIDEVNFFWKKSTQMTALTIDRMMGYRLISNLAIVRWVFSPANVELFHTSDRLWEMAEAIAFDLAAGLIRKLVSLATDEVVQVWKLDEDLETLRERFELTGALLNDAHSQNLIMSTAKMWFHKLEAVARVAEAFMDELEYEVTRRKVENRVHQKVRDFFIPSKNSISYGFKVARKIKYINTSFEKICKWATDLGLKPVEHLSSIVPHKEIRTTLPYQDQSLIVGRDNDISKMVNMVCSKDEEDLPVNAILGMGGQGKTTLARMVYNKDAVIKMFPKRMWVTVSEDFDFMKILNQMVTSLTSEPSVLENAEGVIKVLQKRLQGEKFLLVLDDVWNEEPEEWEKLRDSLLAVGGARGSRILVTTRGQKAIDAMRCSDPYQLLKLSDKESWELFEQRAFSNGGVLQTEAFVDLGKSMVERCGGLPLAIKALGGLLYSKKTEKEWLQIQNSEIWKSKGVFSSLRLSYDNLPYSSLKRCFAYCSVIPKDSYIHKDEIIEIWMALGFLSGDGSALMEDIGNEYFDILLWNSLLQDVVRDEYGNIYHCKMHDLVHDLALDVSGNCSVTVATSHDINRVSKALYVRLEGFDDLKPKNLKSSFDTVQALYAEAKTFSVLLPNLKHLRVLVLNPSCKELPSSIENLKYLKHLDITGFGDYWNRNKLPIDITRLYNLQTLRISEYHELPEKICNLINLRHLVIDISDTGYMFIGIERLTCLQTMPPFVASRDQNCLVGQLGGLKNLRGKLRLHDLNEVENFEEASKAKLCEKSNVQHLQLKWRKNEDEREDRECNDEDVMEGLEAHPNLKELTVEDFMGKKFASWIKKMTNLVEITLKNCNRCEVLPPLGHLPKLRTMSIKGMKNVKVIGNSFCVGVDSGALKAVTTTLYPSLIQLSLYQLPELEEWVETVTSTGGIGQSVFPKLERLTIRECPRLRKMPNSSFPCLKELEIWKMESSSMVLESLSRNVSSLTSLLLGNIRDGGGGGGDSSTSSSSSSSSCWNMECRINALLKNNSLSLTNLVLIDCKDFKRLTLGVSLESLEVERCPHLVSIDSVEGSAGLKSISIGGLTSTHLDGVFAHIQSSTLEYLGLGPFSDESEEFTWPFSSAFSFPKLTWLQLCGWEKVKSTAIFDQLQFPTFPALTRLGIWNFKGVKALPDSITKIPSLKQLNIWDCEILESLPTFDESHGLESLDISWCPILNERYSEGSGPEWFKIQHIPHVDID